LSAAVSKLQMTATIDPAEIIVYTLPWCPHCARAKALLMRRGLAFREVDGSGVPNFRHRIAELTGGSTVPQIVIDGEPIGGADRLASLDRLGVLAAIARGQRFPITREVRRVSPSSVARWVAGRIRGRRGISPVSRVEVRVDRTGRMIDLGDDTSRSPASAQEDDGEGVRSSAG